MSNDGPKQIGYLDPFKKTKTIVICFESDVELEKANDCNIDVVYIENGDYIRIRGVFFKDDAKKFISRVAMVMVGKLKLD